MNERSPVHSRNGDTVPLREYIERIFEEHRQAHAQQHQAAERALEEARKVIDRRLDELNNLRASVEEDRNRLLTRDKYDTEHQALEDRVTVLERNSVRAETLTTQADEVRRMRRQLLITIIAGGVLVGINFIVNIIQSTGGRVP